MITFIACLCFAVIGIYSEYGRFYRLARPLSASLPVLPPTTPA